MNKMYEYLKNHAYISYNKKSTYEFELSEERAECIANKYDSLTNELQQKNQKLKERIEYLERSNNRREDTILEQREEVCNRLESNWNVLKKYLENKWTESQDIWFVKIINKMQELEQKK